MSSASGPTARPVAKATTQTSAPGSRRPLAPPRSLRRTAGFTLIELMVVVALVAVAAGLVGLALRDPASQRLENEATRLSALLEAARAQSRASGLPVRWVPGTLDGSGDFRFVGLPDSAGLPRHWLDPQVSAEVVGGRGSVVLGPEPLIGPQRIVLRLADQRIEIATDGLGPRSEERRVGKECRS